MNDNSPTYLAFGPDGWGCFFAPARSRLCIMGRRALGPGESGKITVRGLHPTLGRWRSEASLKAERVRPKRWRGEVRYHDPMRYRIRTITAEGPTKGEAMGAVEYALGRVREAEGLHANAGDLTMVRAARGHLRMLEDGHFDLSPQTVRVYASVIRRHMLKKDCLIADIPLRHLTALQIEADMERIVRSGAPSQIPNYGAVLNAILRRAVKARAIPANPMRDVRLPQKRRGQKRRVYSNGSERRLNRALTPEEDARLLARLEHERDFVADLALVLRYQGHRVGEGCSLRLRDVDLAAGTVTVAGKVTRVRAGGRAWDETLKSDLSYRTQPIREGARAALERRVEVTVGRGDTEYLFAPPGAVWPDKDYTVRLMRRLFDAAELPDVTTHTLRRTVERELEMAGATVSEREAFMGHTERVARMHYADHGTLRPSILAALDRSGVEVK